MDIGTDRPPLGGLEGGGVSKGGLHFALSLPDTLTEWLFGHRALRHFITQTHLATHAYPRIQSGHFC